MFQLDQGSSLYVHGSRFESINSQGIFKLADSSLFVDQTIFNSFQASDNGALIYSNPGEADFTHSTISNGQTTQNGMIYASGFTSRILLDACTFENNKAD